MIETSHSPGVFGPKRGENRCRNSSSPGDVQSVHGVAIRVTESSPGGKSPVEGPPEDGEQDDEEGEG